MKNLKIGLGFDVHKFSKKPKPLILGGVKINETDGLEAISDGDVVLHAVADAFCGVFNLGDIGDYFPPSKKFLGIDSKDIVKFVFSKIKKKFQILNVDIIIIADKPRLCNFKETIVNSLKKILRTDSINLKIKSRENLKIFGSEDSIACLVNCLVKIC